VHKHVLNLVSPSQLVALPVLQLLVQVDELGKRGFLKVLHLLLFD
jgi:hypothetical protein